MSTEQPAYLLIRELREAKGWSQDVLAKHMRLDRSTIAQWETGRTKPSQAHIQKAVGILKSDIATINRNVTVNQHELGTILKELEAAGKDELDKADSLCSYSYLRILSTLILAASGTLEGNVDSRSIDLFFKHRKEIVEEKRLRSSEAIVNVTPKSKAWSSGKNVYEKRLDDSSKVLDTQPNTDVPPEPTSSSE